MKTTQKSAKHGPIADQIAKEIIAATKIGDRDRAEQLRRSYDSECARVSIHGLVPAKYASAADKALWATYTKKGSR